jgi:uncharacterized protein (TIGR00251 family)
MTNSFIIEVRVRPNAKKNSVGGSVGEPPRLVVSVQEPAVDGKANAAVVRELVKVLKLKPRDFTIVHGLLARDKRISVSTDVSVVVKELMGIMDF